MDPVGVGMASLGGRQAVNAWAWSSWGWAIPWLEVANDVDLKASLPGKRAVGGK